MRNLRSAIFNRLAQRIGHLLAYLGEPMLSHQSWMRPGVGPARLAPARAISHFPAPVLVVGGTGGHSTPAAETRALHAAAAGTKALWLLPGFGHAAVGTGWTDHYREQVRALSPRTLGDLRTEPLAPPAPMARGR
ncbi:hypothetical protein [Sphingosinicella terrae]|uniref:hypothetical protein n=1 Tax=Sphingosinicella terrae TaxID=2172047 RepID=UPI0013B4311E|nr:hypothetical protein [Sphingosinicella terrae]